MYGATIPEDAESSLSKQAKNQAPAALDEEAGGDSQPAHKSYGRIIYIGLALLAFVLIAGAAVTGVLDPNAYSIGDSGAFALSTEGPCLSAQEAVQCYTAQAQAKSRCSKIPNFYLQGACEKGFIKNNKSLPPCCVN